LHANHTPRIVQYFPDALGFQPPDNDYVPVMRCPLAVHPRYHTSIERPIEAVEYAHRSVAAALVERGSGR
jgi:hypothetical protein